MTLTAILGTSLALSMLTQVPAPAGAPSDTATQEKQEAVLNGPPALTADQVTAAIAVGTARSKASHGLTLKDVHAGMAVREGMTSQGFQLTVFTPVTWVRELAARAVRAGRPFTHADLRREDLLPLVRVIVYPDIPGYANAGWTGSASVKSLRMEDEARQLAAVPLAQEYFELPLIRAKTGQPLGRFTGLQAVFTMDEMRRLRGSGTAEFFLTVTGDTGEIKAFKVKRKHFDSLPE